MREQERNRTLNTLSMSVIFFYVYKDRVSSGNLGGLPHPIWASPPFPTCPLSPVLCPKVFIRLEKTYRYGKRPGSSIRISKPAVRLPYQLAMPCALSSLNFKSPDPQTSTMLRHHVLLYGLPDRDAPAAHNACSTCH